MHFIYIKYSRLPVADFSQDKSDWELLRALIVFRISSYKSLVLNSADILAFCDRFVSASVMDWVLKVRWPCCAG